MVRLFVPRLGVRAQPYRAAAPADGRAEKRRLRPDVLRSRSSASCALARLRSPFYWLTMIARVGGRGGPTRLSPRMARCCALASVADSRAYGNSPARAGRVGSTLSGVISAGTKRARSGSERRRRSFVSGCHFASLLNRCFTGARITPADAVIVRQPRRARFPRREAGGPSRSVRAGVRTLPAAPAGAAVHAAIHRVLSTASARTRHYSSSGAACPSVPDAFFIRYALMNPSRSPSSTRLTSPTSSLVR